MIFQSDRLYVRRYTMDDLDDFYLMNGDPELMKYIRPPKNFEESKNFLQENLNLYESHPGYGRWALMDKSKDTMVGSFSILPLEHTNDFHLGYVLFKPYWGVGYASEIVRAAIIYAFDQLKLKTLTAVTFAENLASQKVLLKNGFSPNGVYPEGGRENLLFRLNNAGAYLMPIE